LTLIFINKIKSINSKEYRIHKILKERVAGTREIENYREGPRRMSQGGTRRMSQGGT
jgi:hypothetical protein